jgi:hypothetical protein
MLGRGSGAAARGRGRTGPARCADRRVWIMACCKLPANRGFKLATPARSGGSRAGAGSYCGNPANFGAGCSPPPHALSGNPAPRPRPGAGQTVAANQADRPSRPARASASSTQITHSGALFTDGPKSRSRCITKASLRFTGAGLDHRKSRPSAGRAPTWVCSRPRGRGRRGRTTPGVFCCRQHSPGRRWLPCKCVIFRTVLCRSPGLADLPVSCLLSLLPILLPNFCLRPVASCPQARKCATSLALPMIMDRTARGGEEPPRWLSG